jgi:hypothetical protein
MLRDLSSAILISVPERPITESHSGLNSLAVLHARAILLSTEVYTIGKGTSMVDPLLMVTPSGLLWASTWENYQKPCDLLCCRSVFRTVHAWSGMKRQWSTLLGECED